MTPTLLAVSAILCIAICVWLFLIGRDPKYWRLLWLDVFGVLDADTPREQRLTQEFQLRVMAYILMLAFLALGFSCVFWSYDQLHENLRRKTTVERELDYLRKQVEEARGGRK